MLVQAGTPPTREHWRETGRQEGCFPASAGLPPEVFRPQPQGALSGSIPVPLSALLSPIPTLPVGSKLSMTNLFEDTIPLSQVRTDQEGEGPRCPPPWDCGGCHHTVRRHKACGEGHSISWGPSPGPSGCPWPPVHMAAEGPWGSWAGQGTGLPRLVPQMAALTQDQGSGRSAHPRLMGLAQSP